MKMHFSKLVKLYYVWWLCLLHRCTEITHFSLKKKKIFFCFVRTYEHLRILIVQCHNNQRIQKYSLEIIKYVKRKNEKGAFSPLQLCVELSRCALTLRTKFNKSAKEKNCKSTLKEAFELSISHINNKTENIN